MDNKHFLEKIKKSHGLTMKGLRKFILENSHLPDDMPVLCERVTDIHFKNENGRTGWDTYKVEGFHYTMELKRNEDIKKGEYESLKLLTPEQLNECKEEFYQSWCITKDKDSILIYNHY